MSTSKKIIEKYSVYIILAVLVLLFSCFNPLFLSGRNIFNLITQNTYFLIASVGLAFVMIGGGIDLSVGYQMSLVGVISAMLMTQYNSPIWLVVIIAVLLGTVLGVINGVICTKIKIFPLIATLATSTVYQGISYMVSKAKTYRDFPDAFRMLSTSKFLGLPFDVYLTIFIILFAAYVLNKTYYGRHILAVGGNAEVARLSGIEAKLIQVSTYGICGFFFAIATLDMISKSNSTSSSFGPGTEFTCMTAAIVGGISFIGGKGSMLGLTAGVFIMQVLGNGMQLAGWGTYSQYVVKGVILLLAVAFDGLKNSPSLIIRKPKEEKENKKNEAAA